MGYLQTAKKIGYTKIWGEHSLTVGNGAALAIGVALIYFHPLGKWSLWVAVAVITIGLVLF
jgi:membrane protein YdbS with pleckstrin-like domain